MSQKLHVNGFERIKVTSQFNEFFTESYNKENDEGYFLEIDVKYPEKLHDLHQDVPFLPERTKLQKAEKFVGNLCVKKNMLIT